MKWRSATSHRAVVAATVAGIIALIGSTTIAQVASAADGAASRWNRQTGVVTGQFAENASPTAVAFSPDGATAYLASEIDVDPGGQVGVIDTSTDSADTSVSGVTAGFPTDVAITPATASGQVAFLTSFDSQVQILDVGQSSAVGTLSGYSGSNPAQVALSADGTRGLITNWGSDSVSVVNVAEREERGTPLGWSGTRPWGVAFTPDGNTAYVTDRGSNTVSVLEWVPENLTFLQTATITGFDDPYAVAFTPDGTTAYVLNSGLNSQDAGSVAIVNVASGAVTGTVTGFTGVNPSAIAITAEGDAAYVTNSGNNSVSVIDTATQTEIGTVAGFTGVEPTSIAISPNGTKAYVASRGDTDSQPATPGTVSVLYIGPTPTPPGAPTIDQVQVFAGLVGVTFTPGAPGTFANTGYTATVYETGQSTPVASQSSTTTYIEVPGLTNGISYTVKVTADNPAGDVDSEMSAPFVVGVPPQFVDASPPAGTVNKSYSYTFTASGTPTPALFVTTPIPAGLGVSQAPGSLTISGTPVAAWRGDISVTAQNALASVVVSVPLTIENAVGGVEPGPGPSATPAPTPTPTLAASSRSVRASTGLPETGGEVPVVAIVLGIGMLAAGGILFGTRAVRRKTAGRR